MLNTGGLGLLDGDGIPAAGVVAQQLYLHQGYMGVFGGADAGQVGGNAVLGVAAHDLHDGQLAALGGVDSEIGQRMGVGGVQRRLKDDGGVSLACGGQMVHEVGVVCQPSVGLGAHAAGGEIAEISGGGHTGGQGRGQRLGLRPALGGQIGQRR